MYYLKHKQESFSLVKFSLVYSFAFSKIRSLGTRIPSFLCFYVDCAEQFYIKGSVNIMFLQSL